MTHNTQTDLLAIEGLWPHHPPLLLLSSLEAGGRPRAQVSPLSSDAGYTCLLFLSLCLALTNLRRAPHPPFWPDCSISCTTITSAWQPSAASFLSSRRQQQFLTSNSCAIDRSEIGRASCRERV